MCCNGTLFNYVTLVPDDLPKLKKYPQLRFKDRNGQGSFGEPCVLHSGSGCSAYDDRPATCSRYVCGVLVSVAKDELTELEAVDVIKEARALVDNVKELIPFAPGEPLAVSTWEAAPDGVSEEAKLAWDRTVQHVQKYLLKTHPPAKPAVALTTAVSAVVEASERTPSREKREKRAATTGLESRKPTPRTRARW